MKKEIEIVGAGPSGLVAAINLARAGYSVTVYEEKADVGHRFHGDYQGLENWSTKEDVTLLLERIGIGQPGRYFVCHPYNELTVFDANLNPAVIRSDLPLFYLVRRGDAPGCLDRGLLEIALEAGVQVVFSKRVERLESGGIVSIGPRAADAIAKGIVFDTTTEDMAAAILDDRLATKGYAYLLIHNGKGTLTTCLFRDFKREREYFERTVETFKRIFPSLDLTNKKEFGGYGNFFTGGPLYESEKYYTGEAAGFQDCLWGFGLRYAMVSGYLAATSIIESSDYVSLLKKELLPMQKISLVNRFLYECLGNRGYTFFINWLARGDTAAKVRSQYNPSRWKMLIYPLARWWHQSSLVDKGCHSEDCTCVWCKCKKELR